MVSGGSLLATNKKSWSVFLKTCDQFWFLFPWHFNTVVTEDPFLWECDAASMDERISTFRVNVVISKLRDLIIPLIVTWFRTTLLALTSLSPFSPKTFPVATKSSNAFYPPAVLASLIGRDTRTIITDTFLVLFLASDLQTQWLYLSLTYGFSPIFLSSKLAITTIFPLTIRKL